MLDNSKYTWIRTRDGSPTLWSNGRGESFRSVKGAFTESYVAFVEPAFRSLNAQANGPLALWTPEPISGTARPPASLGGSLVIGEFGLGPGTNWLLWGLLAARAGLDFEYFAIEAESSTFGLGRELWPHQKAALSEFFAKREIRFSPDDITTLLRGLRPPKIYSSPEAALAAGQSPAHLWFHDPFGYDVNPDGYSPETLHLCARLWDKKRVLGFSYACNRRFREGLEALPGPVTASVVPTGDALLKRERLEFYRTEGA